MSPRVANVTTWLLVAAVLIGAALWSAASYANGLSKPLPAQLLADALEAYARESGMQVLYAPEIVRGVMSQGASPHCSTEETLLQLLRGTDLTFQYVNERTITILRLPPVLPASTKAPRPLVIPVGR